LIILLYVSVGSVLEFQDRYEIARAACTETGHAAATDELSVIRLTGELGMCVRGRRHFKHIHLAGVTGVRSYRAGKRAGYYTAYEEEPENH
jgi:hypothetical protein